MLYRSYDIENIEDNLKKLAVDNNTTGGKYVSIVSWNIADNIWQKLVQFLLDGNFSDDDVTHLVVKGRESGSDNPHNFYGSMVKDCAAIMVCTSGVNFTNVLCAAFMLVDPKTVKKIENLTVFFTLLGSEGVKAVRRILMKLSPGRIFGVDVNTC